MRILADENIPGDAVVMLRSRGHDVVWVRTDSPGDADESHLSRAVSEQRLLITFDKDFGQARLPPRAGGLVRGGVVSHCHAVLKGWRQEKNCGRARQPRLIGSAQFSVVDDRRVRMTPLPGKPPRQPR